ncbi:MAG: hypothetical protein CMB52_04585 [Euryarchaeota archaeon]|nr:hypothetical protein [Euryarchaeota archaeon]|tara:strand:+ start:8580 stop:9527 length:948 start_codon:yes stop_codon:yes gene_type:complete
MESLIRDLLKQLGATLESAPPHVPCPGITLLGVLSRPPVTQNGPKLSTGTHVWHAHDGWAPLDNLEIERWLVDAPAGVHWMLSERPLRLEQRPTQEGVDYEVWGPERFAQWLGNAILNGDLNATIPTSLIQSSEITEAEHVKPVQVELGPTAFRPQVELQTVLEKLALTHAEHRPVLLSGRVWTITGILRGPENAAERGWWELVEDPYSGEILQLEGIEKLDFIPNLERMEPDSWPDESQVAPHLAKMCEERRHYVVTESSGTHQVQGSVLHWWKLDPSSAEMTPRLALLPAWQIRIPERGIALIHGLNGQLIPM